MLPAKYNAIFAAWQERFTAWKMGKRPPPYPARIITKSGLKKVLYDRRMYHEGMGLWTEDVIIRGYLEDSNWQILYREDSPLHHGFDFVTKHVPTGKVVVSEMKMSSKVGKLRTYLKKTKTKGRQMSLQWVKETAQEIREHYPLAYFEIVNAINNGLLKRALFVANHTKRPRGWLSASYGKMGIKVFHEDEFRATIGFE